jgi:hypothetical protein
MSETTLRDEPDLVEDEEPEELTPEVEKELPGSVQLYLREIGAVALLKAADEVRLAKEIEHGRLLARWQRELVSRGEKLTYENLARYVLDRVRSCSQRLRPILEIDSDKLSDVLFSRRLQTAIQGQIDEDLAEALADVIGTSGRRRSTPTSTTRGSRTSSPTDSGWPSGAPARRRTTSCRQTCASWSRSRSGTRSGGCPSWTSFRKATRA